MAAARGRRLRAPGPSHAVRGRRSCMTGGRPLPTVTRGGLNPSSGSSVPSRTAGLDGRRSRRRRFAAGCCEAGRRSRPRCWSRSLGTTSCVAPRPDSDSALCIVVAGSRSVVTAATAYVAGVVAACFRRSRRCRLFPSDSRRCGGFRCCRHCVGFRHCVVAAVSIVAVAAVVIALFGSAARLFRRRGPSWSPCRTDPE